MIVVFISIEKRTKQKTTQYTFKFRKINDIAYRPPQPESGGQQVCAA